MSPFEMAVRRLVDIVVSLVFLVLLSPILLTVAVAIAIDSPGGPLYFGWRVGRRGRTFRMWKFRSMGRNADKLGSITGRNDNRITRIGAFLRNTKLDELPQLVNVLWGDMTLVGPRPEAPDIVARYTSTQRSVLEAKPGLTGVAQLEWGEESQCFPEGLDAREYYIRHVMDPKIRLDLAYLRVRTPLTDLQIVVRTAFYVLWAVLRPCLRLRSERTT